MKSYLKFLSRNKAYTVIDVFGLAVSFMFLIIIGAYTWQENHLDSQQSKLERMYLLGMDFDHRSAKITGSHYRIIERLANQFPEIETGAPLSRGEINMLNPADEPVTMYTLFTDSAFFSIFDFELEEGDPGMALTLPNSLVVTREFARKMWGDEDPIGKSLKWNQNDNADPMTVTGVIKPLTNSMLTPTDGKNIEALVNFMRLEYINDYLTAENMGNATGIDVVLLAKEGHDLKMEERKYHDFAKGFFWILQLPEDNISLKVIPYDEYYFSEYLSSNRNLEHGNLKLVNMLFLFGLVILLFALMNYVNLTVALSGYRAKEMATRRLLGDSRSGIMAKLIGESLALCMLSFVIGAAMAWLAFPFAENLLATKIHIADCITPLTVIVTAGIILLMGILAGIVPAWLISSAKPIDVVRGTFRRRTKMVFSKVFIVVQNVITIVMIATAVTMYLQVEHLVNAPLGYDTDDVMYIEYFDGGPGSNARTFMQRVEQLPGVEAVSKCAGHPLQGGNNETGVYMVGGEKRTLSFQIFLGDANFLKVLGMGIDRDNQISGTKKLYLNHQALSELGLDENANSVPAGGSSEEQALAGVLSDFKIRGILADQHPVRVYIYSNQQAEDFWGWGFLIKVNGDKDQVAQQVKDIYHELNNYEYPRNALYLQDDIRENYKAERNMQHIVTIFAMIALIISLLGLIAMSTYFVNQRQREIAVKKVFGCESDEVLRRLVSTFLAYIGIAFVIAVPVIYHLMQWWLSTFAYRISLYWWIYAVAGVICTLVAILAVFAQSYRAANANPVKTLYQN